MFDYYGPRGPIDNWHGTLTQVDAIKELIEINRIDKTSEELVDLALIYGNMFYVTEENIRLTLKTEWGEEPGILRYWTFPYDADMRMCAIAKIGNNGETFIFTDEKEILEKLGIEKHDVIKGDKKIPHIIFF